MTEIARVCRAECGRAVAVVVRDFGNVDPAAEAVQEAFAVVLARGRNGTEPGGWCRRGASAHRAQPSASRPISRW